MMELWAFCTSCGRWFFTPAERLDELNGAPCPACMTPAERFEARVGDSSFEVHLARGVDY